MDIIWSLLFFAWAGVCTFGIRALLVRLLRPRFRLAAWPLAYLGGAALFALSLLVVKLTGFRMTQFDGSIAQWIGLVTLGFSPIGIPLLYGAPVVLIMDAATGLHHLWRTRNTAIARA